MTDAKASKDVEPEPVEDDPTETWIVYADRLEPPDANGFQAPHYARITSAEYAKLGI